MKIIQNKEHEHQDLSWKNVADLFAIWTVLIQLWKKCSLKRKGGSSSYFKLYKDDPLGSLLIKIQFAQLKTAQNCSALCWLFWFSTCNATEFSLKLKCETCILVCKKNFGKMWIGINFRWVCIVILEVFLKIISYKE